MKVAILAASALFVGFAAFAHTSKGPLPSFSATALTGQTVTRDDLIGQRTVLIMTPSREAAEDTRQWAHKLRKTLDTTKVRVRDVIAVNLPFFISEQYAVSRARDQIPSRYYKQTWLTGGSKLETALGIPTDSEQAFVFVLDARGRVVARVKGGPTPARVHQIESAIKTSE